jgi:two-component system cell cycle response regulator DivK
MTNEMRQPLVLVVDDVEEDSTWLRTVLERGGFDVCIAGTAELGLQMARQRHPALIIMDVKLPGISGMEATRRLKLDPLTARTPVIVVTAHPLERQSARDARYDVLLQKPVDEAALIENVNRLLDGSR